MFALAVRISTLFAIVFAVACSSSGEGGPAQQVGGQFRATELAPIRGAQTPEPSPTFPAFGFAGVSEAEARRLAEASLRSGRFPLIQGGILPREIHFASRDEMAVLARERALGFSMNSLPSTSDLFWIVNFLDYRDDDEIGTYSGAVLDAETGEIVLTFLNRGAPVGSR